MPTRLDRVRGALVGLYVGDAHVAPYENRRTHDIRADIEARGGRIVPRDYLDPWHGKRTLPMGHPTDDTELAVAFAQSLAVHGRLDEEDLYARMRGFIHGKVSLITGGKAYGCGHTLLKSLKPDTFAESDRAFQRGEIPLPPSNGSLMRNAPAGLVSLSIYSAFELAQRQSRVTHRHPAAALACAAHAALLVCLCQGMKPAVAL
jgi:ADP-ribosylglycohydrolase